MLLLGLLVVFGASSAEAQAGREAEARALFAEGRRAVEEGRFVEARQALEESLALHANAGTAFNLALAFEGLGEVLGAVEILDGLLRSRFGPLHGQQEVEVTRLRAQLQTKLGHLRVQLGPRVVDVLIDGEPVSGEGNERTVTVDPGERVITAVGKAGARAVERVSVAPGSVVELELTLPASSSRAGSERASRTYPEEEPGRRTDDDANQDGWLSEPTFWVVMLGAVVLVAGGLVIGLGFLDEEDPKPVTDPIFGTTTALHF